MDFVVRYKDGSEEGPIDQETLRKRVEADKITPDTQVRNSLLKNWREASKLEFLDSDFNAQKLRLAVKQESEKTVVSKFFGVRKRPQPEKKDEGTAFLYEYLPKPAGVIARLCAALFDWLLLGLVALSLLAVGMSTTYLRAQFFTQKVSEPLQQVDKANLPAPVAKAEETRPPSNFDDLEHGFHRGSLWTDTSSGQVYACILAAKPGKSLWCDLAFMNKLFHKLFVAFALFTLLYFGFTLGFFSQTFGMWFWGIFLALDEKGKEAVFPLRAFAFGLLSMAIGFTMPFFSFVAPDKRALHDKIAGVRLIGVAAKPKT